MPRMMVQINDQLLEEAKRLTGARTKRAAIEMALRGTRAASEGRRSGEDGRQGADFADAARSADDARRALGLSSFKARGSDFVKRAVAVALEEGVVVTVAPVLSELLVGLHPTRPADARAIEKLLTAPRPV